MPKINLIKIRKIILTVFIVAVSFSGGYAFGVKGFQVEMDRVPNVRITRELPLDKSDVDFALFWEVWDTLEAKYFDKNSLVASDMVYGAIKGMVEALGDPYTVFLPPRENRVTQEDLQGTFEGVGIQIGFKGTQLAVIAPLPESPAEKEGLRAGDLIIGIKDEVKNIDRGTVGITLPEAVQIIRGPAGSKVTLVILRDGLGEPLSVEITRAKVEVPSVILEYVGPNDSIAHLRLLKFVGDTNGEWESGVRDILGRREVNAVILDLRNNPGGYLQGAVDIAAEFLESGSLVAIEEHSSGQRREFKAEKIGRLTNVKLVVLINQGSASAAEILAGALRDQAGIRLIGEPTFGKGTIQEPIQLDGGSGLHITTARWLTPKGIWVNETGLEPDVKIEDDPETSEDEQLLEAIRFLTS